MARAIQPVGGWWKAFHDHRKWSVILILSMASTFIGGAGIQQEMGAALPAMVRLVRFFVIMSLFFWALKTIASKMSIIHYAGKPALFMAMFGLFSMLSAIYSVDSFITLWKGMEVFTLVLTGMCISAELKSYSDIRQYIAILSLIMLFFILSVGLGIVLDPGEAFSKMEQSTQLVVRGLAPKINSNTVTQFSAILAMLIFPIALNSKKEKAKMAWIVFAFAIVILLLGHSRTSIFSCAIALVLSLYYSGRKIMTVLLVAFGTLSVMFLEFVLVYIYRGQNVETFTTLTGRVTWWEKAYEFIELSPIFGHGYYAAQRVLLNTGTLDSTYIDVLIGLGFSGLAIFIIPIILTAVRLFFTRPKRDETIQSRIIWLQLMAIYILLVVRSITGSTFQVIHPNLVIYMFLIVAVEAYARTKRHGGLSDIKTDDVDVEVKDTRILSRRKSSKILKNLSGRGEI
jgi:O-antigen ligase